MLYVEAKSNRVISSQGTVNNSGSNNQQHQDADMAPIGNEFDVYLSALGFMPVDEGMQAPGAAAAAAAAAAAPTMTSPATSPTTAAAPGRFASNAAAAHAMAVQQQTNQLGDWFSGNRYMMGLLEEDLSQFHPNTWNTGPGGWKEDS